MIFVASLTSERPPPMTPATACGFSASAMTSISGSSARSRPSSVLMRSPVSGAADTNFTSRELVEVERVHRLAELEQHVVGDVDDVVDRANAGGLQPRASQAGDGATVTSATAAA